jgi:hypothetical protein
MRVLFINNSGAGFADYVDVTEGTTIEKFLTQRMPDSNAADYLIRVNRQPCARDQVLHEGDRISATPTKVEGARTDPAHRAAA